MALTYKTRRRLALLVLCVGLPAYIVMAVSLVALIDRPSLEPSISTKRTAQRTGTVTRRATH
jgi:hypothetical protein